MRDGQINAVKIAFSEYMRRWHAGLFGDTADVEAFSARSPERAIIWAPSRMVDAAEEMLAGYRRNNNDGLPGHRSVFPVVMLAMSRDYMPTTGDRGRQAGDRMLVKLRDDAPDDVASIYGYRQGMGDIRTQVVIIAAEEPSARSLAVQFSNFVGAVANRRFYAAFTWGEYTLQMPIMHETPDIQFMDVQTDQKNVCILAADINLTATFPFLDAPKDGEPNDGSSHNPPGYPVVTEVHHLDQIIPGKEVIISAAGVTRP